jgi:multidrug efflux pump subunit AcrB
VNRVVAWFARNPVAANLMMLFIVVGGLATLPTIPQKPFPDIDIDIVHVTVEHPGAAPEEVESGVCSRIEEEVDGVEGIDRIRSVAAEGACTVSVEFLQGSDMTRALSDVKNRVDSIDTFPEEAEEPIVALASNQRPVIDVAISGELTERTLKEIGQRVRDEITRLPGISQAELALARPYEIAVEVSEADLRRHGLSFDQVADAVRRSSLDLPGGSIKGEGEEILLRTRGQAYWGPEFEGLVLLTHADGTRLMLGDVARVVDSFEDTDQVARFDGHPAIMVRVFRVGAQDVLHISRTVHDYVREANLRMPEGVSLTVWRDASTGVRERRDTMIRNGIQGFVLVILVLALFLRLRLAFWVALGVPVSFLGAFAVLPWFGLSIDVISLFAFLLVLGILVDDATVVGENVHTLEERGLTRLDAAIQGTQQVATPVIFGVLTSVAAFAPLLFVSGFMGTVFRVMATVVIACLSFSLIESQLVLPAHLAHGTPRSRDPNAAGIAAGWARLQDRFAQGLERFTHGRFRNWLGIAIEWRYLAIGIGIAMWLWSLGMVASGRMHFSFFPPLEADYVTARLTMPQGTAASATLEAVRQIESAIGELRSELDPEHAPEGGSVVLHALSAVGQQPFRSSQDGPPGGAGVGLGGHLGEITIELISGDQRQISTREVAQRWREIVGPVAGAEELLFASSLFSAGEEIHIQLQGPNVEQLEEAADRVKQALAGFPGVIDIADSFRAGKNEVKLAIRPGAEALGLGLRDLARQVRQGFYGEEAQRVQRGRDDVRVMVRYPEADRRSLGDLENMRLRTSDGGEVPFDAVAHAHIDRGYSTIRRADRERIVSVTADVDRARTTGNEVLAAMRAGPLPEILRDYPGTSYRLEGIQDEQARALGGLATAYPVALFAIYALLAIPLSSYLQPLLIMSVIPFGMVGAIAGHVMTGQGLSFMSVQGMIALTGVVVNSSLILVHSANERLAAGAGLRESVIDSAVARFRPIVLTSLTTFAGLTPLLLERSVQAQFLIPMATSLAFGVIFATAITLVLLPCATLILEDLRTLPARARAAGGVAALWRDRPTPLGGQRNRA